MIHGNAKTEQLRKKQSAEHHHFPMARAEQLRRGQRQSSTTQRSKQSGSGKENVQSGTTILRSKQNGSGVGNGLSCNTNTKSLLEKVNLSKAVCDNKDLKLPRTNISLCVFISLWSIHTKKKPMGQSLLAVF